MAKSLNNSNQVKIITMSSNKKTVTLSDKAAKYFADVQYALSNRKTGDGVASNSDVINESLESLHIFEQATDNQLLNWIDDHSMLKNVDAKIFASNPTQENLKKLAKSTIDQQTPGIDIGIEEVYSLQDLKDCYEYAYMKGHRRVEITFQTFADFLLTLKK